MAPVRLLNQQRLPQHSTLFDVTLADGDVPNYISGGKNAKVDKCHEIIRRPLRRSGNTAAVDIYTHLLFPFTDVFCFFAADIGGFRQIARHLATWLERGHSSTLPESTLPSVVIVTDKITPRAEIEEEARKAFLWMLREETAKDLIKQILAIDIVALFPTGTMSIDARYRRVKERLMERSDQARNSREGTRTLFSVTHFAALFKYASGHFPDSLHKPFDFIRASRAQNLVAPDLDEHLSNFLKHITSSDQLIEFAAPTIASALFLDSYPPDAHTFEPKTVFDTLYRDVFCKVSKARTIAFKESNDIILRSGFINMVETNLICYFQQYISDNGKSAVEIHRSNLIRFQHRWRCIQSSSTCLCCLRRRPQYHLPCGHCICENCVIVLGDCCEDDPWEMPNDITVRTTPPTAGVGVLCIDGGGTRGIIPLTVMKLIQDRLGPIPLQRCITVSFGVSVGVIIAIDHFILGRPLEESIQTFSEMAGRVFKRRVSFHIPLISRMVEIALSYFTDGLYPAKNVDAVLKDWVTNKSILDCSYATSTGTKLGLPVATVSNHPSYRFFTNYNGVGERDGDQEKAIIKPKDGFGNVPLWEIARSASAAPGFFPPKHINEVGTFQDAGPLENDPLLWALSEVSAMFPLLKEPNFVISLGTGEPGQNNYEISTEDCRNIRKNGMFTRICNLIMEKMRDKTIYRLNVDFETTEPRLDDSKSIPELISKVETDQRLSASIDEVAHCLIASLFYFELDSAPERYDGKYVITGHVLCSIRRSDLAFEALFSKLSAEPVRFWVNDWPMLESVNDPSCFGKDGNFRKRVRIETSDGFTMLLKGETKAYNISGSPFTVKGLVAAQGLDAPFGRADHALSYHLSIIEIDDSKERGVHISAQNSKISLSS
ncbi:FabD/lysophospholipase-like protein [Bimuria novae-zelandiae CBS 107.79]|uniref:FabD/lysophospholipase-like protein n=1 Tax=Bimuria novae-zelandiae CBS 107.79 TaxID=1447943 RepID=A0A6A5UMP4_9PLEO|nr:FabD/lysophospholipase-like protein [Bimuria novae-zelandiae CBS 107.79]